MTFFYVALFGKCFWVTSSASSERPLVLELIPVPKPKPKVSPIGLWLGCNLRLGVVSSLNSEFTLGDKWISISCPSGLGLGDRGGGVRYWDRGLGEGDGICEEVKRDGAGDRGAIIPSDVPRRIDVCLILETPSKEIKEKMDRTSDTRGNSFCIEDATEGELGSAVCTIRIGRIRTLLKNKNTYQ